MRPNAQTARVLLALLPAIPTVLARSSERWCCSRYSCWCRAQPALDAIGLIFQGAFGSSFAWQSTLLRASPLMLTALCVALPAQVGLVVIGGEGALALGGMCAAIVPQMLPAGTPWLVATPLMAWRACWRAASGSARWARCGNGAASTRPSAAC